MSYQMKDETGFGVLLIVGAVAVLVCAFIWGMNVGYDMALVGIGQQAQEVLR